MSKKRVALLAEGSVNQGGFATIDTDNPRDECKHGSLRRQCETCALETQLAETQARLDKAVEASENMKWINVEDRLPHDTEMVWVYGGSIVFIEHYFKARWERRGYTHWQPLIIPAPPEIEDK